MRAIAGQPPSDWDSRDTRRRVVSLVLAVLVHILLLLLLLRLAPPHTIKPPSDGGTVIFNLPSQTAEKAAKQPARQQTKSAAASAPHRAPPQPTRAPAKTNSVAQPWVINPELAGFDLSKVPAQSSAQVAANGSASGEATGSGEGDSRSAGQGPGGVQLYAAQWVREPTNAEMNPYMPAGHYAGGWADIACRTVPRFHVEDCEELGQSPPGSGLSRALREASFQFLVRPPRINGKTMVGEWVRIHFTWYEKKPDRPGA